MHARADAGGRKPGAEVSDAAGLAVVGLGTCIEVGNRQTGGEDQGKADEGPDSKVFAMTRYSLSGVRTPSGEHEVRAVAEIHHATICPSASPAHRLVYGFDPEGIGAIFDPGNTALGGIEDCGIGLELPRSHLVHFHLKKATKEVPEDGVVDFGELFAAPGAISYDGWLAEEHFSGARPGRESLGHNLKVIKALIAGTQN